jgi:hypothetical protein
VCKEHDFSTRPAILGETSNKLSSSVSANSNFVSKIKPEPVVETKKKAEPAPVVTAKPKEEKPIQIKQKENVKVNGKIFKKKVLAG